VLISPQPELIILTWKLNIHGDSGGICTTLGNESMSDSKQKSSYEHGSDFERLWSYGHFLIPVHALMWTALTEPAGGWWLTVCIASITFASWLVHPATGSPVSVSRHLGNKGKVGWVFAWLQADMGTVMAMQMQLWTSTGEDIRSAEHQTGLFLPTCFVHYVSVGHFLAYMCHQNADRYKQLRNRKKL